MPSSHKTKTAKPSKKQGKYKAKQGVPPVETRFKPGQTGNPNGRPKKLPAIDTLMAEVLGSIDDKKSEAQAILEAIARKAKKGDVRAAEVLLDRGYGKAKQSIETTMTIAPEPAAKTVDHEALLKEVQARLDAEDSK